uniref:Uncharacterized protein n=1 Tax=Thermofilum pendens TaxID=2269 RepID=A0A7C1P0S9_THEPE
MERVLLEQKSRRELLDYIVSSGSRAREKIAEAERLLSFVKSRVESNPRLKELLGRVAESLWIPDPPLPGSAEEVGRRLEEYEKHLDALLEKLKTLSLAVDVLERVLPEVDKLRDRLERWALVMRDVSPPLHSELARFLARLNRVLQGLPSLEVGKGAELLRDLLESGEQLEAKVRAEYNKSVGLLLSEVSLVKELLSKALNVSYPHDRFELEEGMKKLSEVEQRLHDLKKVPAPFSPPQVHAELARIKALASQRLSEAVKPGEAAVLEAFSKLAAGGEHRLYLLHELVESISRRSGISLEEVLVTLYELSRKGLIKPLVKIA